MDQTQEPVRLLDTGIVRLQDVKVFMIYIPDFLIIFLKQKYFYFYKCINNECFETALI